MLGQNADLLKEMIQELTKSSLVVAAAGNKYPNGSSRDNSNNLDVIFVGNINQHGIVDHSSDESLNISIVAPAGSSKQMTYNTNGYDPYWGGTSGATPLVAGALADVTSVLGEITFQEAKRLLEKTALPTSNSLQKPQRNGPGMLNTFKLIKVALRLKEKGWPENRAALLNDNSIFDFMEHASQLRNEAEELLKSDDCNKKKQGLKNLRRSHLLSSDQSTANILAGLYEKLGYVQNAQFYKNFNREELKSFMEQSSSPHPSSSFQLDFYDKKSIERAKTQLGL